MADLPAYVKILAEGFQKERASATSRTPFEDGMTKQLKTKSRVLIARPVTFEFSTYSDYTNFLTWFKDTINYGADWFNFTDPEDGTIRLARFENGQLSQERPILGTTRWRLVTRLETWSNS